MAQRIERFNITVPADTAAPGTIFPLTFRQGTVTGFEIEIPTGHARLTGLQINYGAFQVVPYSGNAYVRGDGVRIAFDTEDFPAGTGWSAQAFNLDQFYDHTFHVDVLLDELDSAVETLPPVLLLPSATTWSTG